MDHDDLLPVTCHRSQERSIIPTILTSEYLEVFQNQIVYDVPSSDEQSSISLGLHVGHSSKRRKLHPVSMEKYASVAWDDDSLQKHIATETAVTSRKRMRSPRRQLSSTGTMTEASSKSTSKQLYPLTQPRAAIRQSVSSNGSQQDGAGTSLKLGATFVHPVSLTKSQRMKDSMQGASGASSIKAPSKTRKEDPTRVEPAEKSAILRNNRGKSVVSKNSLEDLSSSYVTKIRSSSSQDISFQGKSVPAQGFRMEQPGARDGSQDLSPNRLKIVGLDNKSLTSGSRVPHAASKANRQLQDRTHTSNIGAKIKDRLHTPRKISSRSGKVISQRDSDSNGESPSPGSSSGKSQSNVPLSIEGALGSTTIEKSESQSLSLIGGLGPQTGNLKVTYGSQRSFLKEDYLGAAFSINTLGPDITSFKTVPKMTGPLREISKPQRLHILSEAVEDSTDSKTGAIRSIHELREAGGNARMTGEIEATFDDIDEKNHISISLRRSGLLGVAMKLLQPEFRRRFVDLGLGSRLLTHVCSCTDTIAGILLLTAMVQIIARPTSPHTVSEFAAPGVIKFLGRHLGNKEDLTAIVRIRTSNMSKALQAEVTTFCASFMLADVWRNGKPVRITGHILSLQCLEYVVRHQRKAGSTSDILTHEILESLTEILTSNRVPGSTSDSGVAAEVQLSLSILESSSLARTQYLDCKDMLWTSGSVAKMTEFLSCIQMETGPQAGNLRTLALRLCLNLTNNNSAFCHAFTKPNIIHATLSVIGSGFSTLSAKAGEESTEILVDNLVLSLGLLINLAEWNEASRKIFVLRHEDKPQPLCTLCEIFECYVDRLSEVGLLKFLCFSCADSA